MVKILPPFISTKDAPNHLADLYNRLHLAAANNELELFQNLLAKTDASIVNVVNPNGLTLFEIVGASFYSDSRKREGRGAIYMDLVVQKFPQLLTREEVWKDIFGLHNTHHGEAHSVYTNSLLKTLYTTYNIPQSDEELLLELCRKQEPQSHKVYYALLRDFRHSKEFGLNTLTADDLFWAYNNWLFKSHTREIARRLDQHWMQLKETRQKRSLWSKFSPTKNTEKQKFVVTLADTACHGNERDMWRDFHDRVIEPIISTLMQESDPTSESDSINWNFGSKDSFNLLVEITIQRWLEEGLLPSEVIERVQKLSRSWHHPSIRFAPRGITPHADIKAGNYPEPRWYPLLPTIYSAKNGWSVESLQCEKDLKNARDIF